MWRLPVRMLTVPLVGVNFILAMDVDCLLPRPCIWVWCEVDYRSIVTWLSIGYQLIVTWLSIDYMTSFGYLTFVCLLITILLKSQLPF